MILKSSFNLYDCLIGFLLITSNSFSGEPNLFHSQTYGYHLIIPNGWNQIPKSVVAEGISKVVSSDAKEELIYDAAFQRNAAGRWFQTPYVMIQVVELKRQIHEDEFEEIARLVTGTKLTDNWMEETFTTEALNLLSTEITTGKMHLDRDNRLFWYSLSAYVQGVGTVMTTRVGHFGCQALIILSFCDTVRNWDESKFERDSIFKSFRFEPDMAYNNAYKETRNDRLDNILVGGLKELILTLLFVVIGLVVFFIHRSVKGSQKL